MSLLTAALIAFGAGLVAIVLLEFLERLIKGE
jgi:hypothetical protein